MSTLKPCPFCGGPASYHSRGMTLEGELHIVGCGAIMDSNGLYGGCIQADRARSTYSYKSKEKAIEQWNQRPAQAVGEDEQTCSENLTKHAEKWAKEYCERIGRGVLKGIERDHLEDAIRESIEEWIGEDRQEPNPDVFKELQQLFTGTKAALNK